MPEPQGQVLLARSRGIAVSKDGVTSKPLVLAGRFSQKEATEESVVVEFHARSKHFTQSR